MSHSTLKYVDHTYRDFSCYVDQGGQLIKHKKSNNNFPARLHRILSDAANSHVITWMPHGRAWKILNKERLISDVIPNYYVCKKYESFSRQLNGWGFKRLHQSGTDFGCYYHECFLRDLPKLTCLIRRLPANLGKSTPYAEGEPNFYKISLRYPLPPPDSKPNNGRDGEGGAAEGPSSSSSAPGGSRGAGGASQGGPSASNGPDASSDGRARAASVSDSSVTASSAMPPSSRTRADSSAIEARVAPEDAARGCYVLPAVSYSREASATGAGSPATTLPNDGGVRFPNLQVQDQHYYPSIVDHGFAPPPQQQQQLPHHLPFSANYVSPSYYEEYTSHYRRYESQWQQLSYHPSDPRAQFPPNRAPDKGPHPSLPLQPPYGAYRQNYQEARSDDRDAYARGYADAMASVTCVSHPEGGAECSHEPPSSDAPPPPTVAPVDPMEPIPLSRSRSGPRSRANSDVGKMDLLRSRSHPQSSCGRARAHSDVEKLDLLRSRSLPAAPGGGANIVLPQIGFD